jgi:hypothetical protein
MLFMVFVASTATLIAAFHVPTWQAAAVLDVFLPALNPVLNVAPVEIPSTTNTDYRDLAAMRDVAQRRVFDPVFH